MRLIALVLISLGTVWAVLMVVSLGLGTTEFGWSPVVKGRVHALAEMLMWLGVAISVVHTAIDLFLGLRRRLGVFDEDERADDSPGKKP